MTQDLLRLEVTEPTVHTEARTMSYRVLIEASLVDDPIDGRFGDLDEHIFVCETNDWGGVDFLRLVEPRDYALPLAGELFRTANLDIYVASPITAKELVTEVLKDVELLIAGHTGAAVTITQEQ